ncbi:pseudouridine synthase [Candidatus Protochlamydia sp. R18]|uniref:pseudouridine synthase n=1 Tax=Candidatus Protochlamydia sp. R18 TaxID=1353977 RepID=UPI0005A87915|nr:pseudouridine synthase [Candidatus Protochlamydia sp. R18]
METNRLSKVLAAAGIASRRACEELIFQGLVKVNGEVIKVPQTKVNPEIDTITVRDEVINRKEDKVYYLLNKPPGYICSARKNGQTKIILDLFQGEDRRLFTVGRLDKDTQGLLIVTNDGHFANQIIHPSANIQKEYLAKTDQEISHEHLIAIANGTLVEGVFVKPIRVQKVRKGTIKIIIGEGKKREVRMLLSAAGLKVQELTRIRLGGLHLGRLPIGNWRPLTETEKKSIFSN